MLRSAFILFTLFAFAINLSAQENPRIPVAENLYDTDILPAKFHRERREKLREQMPAGSAAVFFTAPVRNRSNDVNYQFHQDPDFYYYSGHIQPEAVLIILKEPREIKGITSNEFIFVKERNPLKETWTGKIPSADEVKSYSEINAVFINGEIETLQPAFKDFSDILIKFPSDVSENSTEKGSTGWLVSQFKKITEESKNKYDKVKLATINASLREIKTPEELILLQKAIDMTCAGFIQTLRAAEPEMTEYQLEAINEFFWNVAGSEYAGYPSIVGGGENGCVLHYETNRKKLLPGDMVVMDMGAEYHGYTADVTRTFPMDGKFSAEETAIYQLVFDAQKAGFEACMPGNNFNEPHKAATKVIAEGLIKLGLIKNAEEVKKYFMHGTSHYLGLDVHDPGSHGPFKPNTVITVEPGIYIKAGSDCDKKWWNIGVRIEDDVLITDSGYRIMSDCIPRTISEIEKLMAKKSFFNQLKN